MTLSKKNYLFFKTTRSILFQEYSLIMSERDSVHKEIEKLQDEVSETKRKMNFAESRTKLQDEEV